MTSSLVDVRHTVRALAASRGVLALCVVCLALGIGAATTGFTIVNGVLLAPDPVSRPDRLLLVSEAPRERPDAEERVSLSKNFQQWDSAPGVGDLRALRSLRVAVALDGRNEGRPAVALNSRAFAMLGLRPIAGRAWSGPEDRPGAPPVALLGEALWCERFGGDPEILGRSVLIDG
jgi:hypothetical protein